MNKDHSITSRFDDGILLITVEGSNTEDNALELMIAATNIMGKAMAKRVLIDLRQLRGRVPIGSLYFKLREVPPLPDPERKVALVDLEENREYAEFHQTSAANVGMDLVYFFDYDKALAWLRE